MLNHWDLATAAATALEACGWTIIDRRSVQRYGGGFIAERASQRLVGEAMEHPHARLVERPLRKPYMGWESTDDAGKVIYWALVSAAEQQATGCIIVPDEHFTILDINRAIPALRRADIHAIVVESDGGGVAIPPALQ